MPSYNDNYLFAPKFSFTPEKICLYNEVSVRLKNTNDFVHPSVLKNLNKIDLQDQTEIKKLVRKFHNFRISDNAYRNLKNKISWLYYLSKCRYVKTYNGIEIYNFKMLFLTLTLPSKQVHTTAHITKDYLNQFITEIKQRTGMNNFVWRLEFQKNSNVHYHIVTDTYIDYFLAQKIWNRIINKGGYVDKYSEKFMNMSLSQYFSYTVQNAVRYGKVIENNEYYSFTSVAKRYALLRKNGFKNPNSVDVKSVSNGKKISSYISKYFGKNNEDKNCYNPLDNEENSKSIRLWFCSRSLSKLKSISHYIDEINWSPDSIIEKAKHVKYVVHRYCTVIYFDFHQLKNEVKKVFAQLFKRYSSNLGYLPAT